jgi:hypothetical protein
MHGSINIKFKKQKKEDTGYSVQEIRFLSVQEPTSMEVHMMKYEENQRCFLQKTEKVQGAVFRAAEKNRSYEITTRSLPFCTSW